MYDILAYTERMQNNTMGWLHRSRQLVDVCRQIGPEAETDALRTEAEIGASRRKITMLGSHDRYAETLPLAHRIIERLDDYEANPERYHDNSYREPKNDQKRADYIRFYRNQAQNFIAAAYASLGDHGNMLTAFRQIEDVVREATAREHIARYNALQQQLEAERQRDAAQRAKESRKVTGFVSLLILLFAIYVLWQWRKTNKQNKILAQQIRDAVEYKKSIENFQLKTLNFKTALNSTL